MGIKGINKLIEKYAPDAYFTLAITKLSGKRIAVDGNIWMYANMAIARKKVISKTDLRVGEPDPNEIRKEWFKSLINYCIMWTEHNITPVFVIDDPVGIADKDGTRTKRRDVKHAARVKIDALYQELNTTDTKEQNTILEELRKELKNYNYISSEDFELFKMVIKGIGIPCLQATGDAEQLCASLCIEKRVALTISNDTDLYPLGCPLVATGLSTTVNYDEHRNKIHNLDCVRLDRVLKGLNMNPTEFLDLCIMSGCDFNTNMPGYAAIKSYALMQTYKSIDNLPRNFNAECLNHHRCRNIFKYVPGYLLVTPEPDMILDNILKLSTDNILKLSTDNILKLSTDNILKLSTNNTVKLSTDNTVKLSTDNNDKSSSNNSNNSDKLPTDNSVILVSENVKRITAITDDMLTLNKEMLALSRDWLEIAGVAGDINKLIVAYRNVVVCNDGYVEELKLSSTYTAPQRRIILNILPQPNNIGNNQPNNIGNNQPTYSPIIISQVPSTLATVGVNTQNNPVTLDIVSLNM